MKKKLTYHNFYFYLLLLSPILVVYILFFALPVVSSMFFSLTNFNGISLDFKWMGLKNYDVAFHDRVFRKAMVNTFLFALGATVLQNFFAILFALALNSKLKLQGFMRMLVFAPCMLSPIVVAFIWQFIYMPDGILNKLLGTDITWLGNRKTALICVVVAHVWMWIGYSATIYMSNLQSISSDILEAADIDGASRWQKFKRIILPMLAPATTINITLAFTQSLKVFDIVYAMTNGGPQFHGNRGNLCGGEHEPRAARIRFGADGAADRCHRCFRAGPYRNPEKTGGGGLRMKKKEIRRVIFTLFMAAVCILVFYPVIMMVLVSLKDDVLLAKEPLSLKTSFAFENYRLAAEKMKYGRALFNSTVLTICSGLLTTFFGACGAYAILRAKRGKKFFLILNALFLMGLALPQQVAMVPLVLWMQKLHVANSIFGLILAFTGANAAYAVFFFSGFVNTVPVTLEEAAYIDGAGPMKTFLKVVFPLLKPPMVTLLIVIALRVWNNFMYPLLLSQGEKSRTLPLTVFFFKGDLSVQWNILFAATTLVILPLMIVYFILQKQIISGMLSGAVKG